MSRDNLLNKTCNISTVTTTRDDYGQFIQSLSVKYSTKCRFRDLTARELLNLGIPLSDKIIRFYFGVIDILDEDVIVLDNQKYEIITINRLGNRTGKCKGIQVDTRFIGFCE